MRKRDVLQAWNRILTGRQPNLSIEITRECPLACPGCYAYETAHLGEAGLLKDLADHRGDDLVQRVLALAREHRPVHLSIVGGEPLVRYRELDILLPRLSEMGIAVQVVTSAVRPIPAAWRDIENLFVVVSIDGLQPEHDQRRAPATYQRILNHIQGHAITVHCTVTRQLAEQPGGLEEFLSFWSGREDVRVIWLSFFTPQVGAQDVEIVPMALKEKVLQELSELRHLHPKLFLPDRLMDGFRKPPASPGECIFARTTTCLSSDLLTPVTPCQLGGNPDCSQCGCMASAGLKALGDVRLLGTVPLRTLFAGSQRIGRFLGSRHSA